MSIILPTAPSNFYTPSLEKLKNDVSASNGSTSGQITILTAAPDNADTAWGEVGAGNKTIDLSKGSLVAGQASIGLISGPEIAVSEANDETGFKLSFSKVRNIEIRIGNVGSILIVGFAVIVGRDDFAYGTDDDVRYIAKIEEVLITDGETGEVTTGISSDGFTVKDGDLIELPQWDIIINYAEASE